MRIRGADISVIIPTYNRSALVSNAITSVQNQSVQCGEVIVIDDGSTDNTAEQISKNFPNVKFLKQSNQGVSAARNYAIKQAKGAWIALLDSDDLWYPDKLSQQVAFLNENPALQTCHTDEIWIRNGRRVNPKHKHAKPSGDIFHHCLPLCCVSPSAILLHQDILADVGLFDETLPACEDYDLWLRIFRKYSIGLIDQSLVTKHGGHDDQLSRKHWGMDRFRVKALIKLLEKSQLTDAQKRVTIDTLLSKCEILKQGSEKRNKHNEAHRYQILIDQWNRVG